MTTATRFGYRRATPTPLPGGRKPYDVVLMFKTFLLQSLYGLAAVNWNIKCVIASAA